MDNISNFTEMSIGVWKDSFVYDLSVVIVSSFLILFGVPGNCLILRVYWTKTRKTNTHILVMALAAADLAVCILRFVFLTEKVLALAGDSRQSNLIFSLLDDFEDAIVIFSVFITMLIALDRYDCICRPQRRFLNPRRRKIVACVAFVLSFAITIPSFLSSNNQSEPVLFQTRVALDTLVAVTLTAVVVMSYGKVYKTVQKHVRVCADWPPTTVQDSLCVISKCSVNLPDTAEQPGEFAEASVDQPIPRLSTYPGVDKKVSPASHHPGTSHSKQAKTNNADTPSSDAILDLSRKQPAENCFSQNNQDTPKWREDQRPTGKNNQLRRRRSFGIQQVPQRPGGAVLQRKTTRMLFITSLMFILTWLPYIIEANLILALRTGAAVNTVVLKIFNVFSLALYINSAINPLIYGLANRRFRQDFKKELRNIKLCSD